METFLGINYYEVIAELMNILKRVCVVVVNICRRYKD